MKVNFGNTSNVGGTQNIGGTNDVTNDTTNKTNPQTFTPPNTTVNPGLVNVAPTVSNEQPGEIIKKLAATDSAKTVDLVSKPTRVTSTTVEFKISGGYDGRLLKPGEQIMFEIPPQFRGRKLASALFAHRQQQGDKSSTPTDNGGKKWDNTPGTTALHFHSTNEGGWRYWNAPWGSSGGDGAKYAELRGGGDPEVEREFEFFKQGTTKVGGGGFSKNPLEVDAIRLKSNGKDPVRVHTVQLTFMPDKPTFTQEMIFSPGTNIGDPLTAAGRSYGKDTSKGTYPGALQLGGWNGGEGVEKLKGKEGWKFEGGQLQIDLPVGKKFTGVEVSCGDTHPDGKHNSDGEVGTQGYSRISMGIQRAGSSSVDWFTQSEGVPPQGVIFGGPNQENFVAKPGDKLIISASSDTTYVMGVRTWHND